MKRSDVRREMLRAAAVVYVEAKRDLETLRRNDLEAFARAETILEAEYALDTAAAEFAHSMLAEDAEEDRRAGQTPPSEPPKRRGRKLRQVALVPLGIRESTIAKPVEGDAAAHVEAYEAHKNGAGSDEADEP
jgi:hypothetical protein